jgi:hypothetical protein
VPYSIDFRVQELPLLYFIFKFHSHLKILSKVLTFKAKKDQVSEMWAT